MVRTLALAVVALSAALAAPAHADGYLSGYSAGGTTYCCGSARYLSDYSYGSYSPGYGGGYVASYSGVSTPIAHPHRADWEQYLANRRRAGGGGSSWFGRARDWYNPAGIRLGAPPGSRYICGTYANKPAACYSRTTAYIPGMNND